MGISRTTVRYLDCSATRTQVPKRGVLSNFRFRTTVPLPSYFLVLCFSVSDVDKIKDKFKQLSTSTREETDQIKKLSNDTHSTLLNVQVCRNIISY